ncbi:aminopeptidase P family protein [Filimonas effusa]|uniref:Xaa-Pro aminopeptidase n=1 Tax=Filimonas effusa TaxID=2508721 RepID=A0A4Q1D9J9_9BACT|nr:aminopeptidase P family protein [Filimonas effusa]RXK86062.1 aminopeptidase P family protein [Filimonas effusa]
MFERPVYIERRQQLMKAVGSGLVLLTGNEDSSMNYKDNIYHFRQDSSFLYFTGIDRPNLFFLLDIDNNTETLFGNDLTIEEMVWTGYVAPLAEPAAACGISDVKPVSALPSLLERARQRSQQVHYLPPYRPETILKLEEWLSTPAVLLQENASVPLIKAIVAQRSIKSDAEIAEIEKGVNTTNRMQLKAMELAAEGITEYAIAGQLQGLAVSEGGQLSFPTILTVNGQYLHNHAGPTVLRNGQMVLCDCGAETAMHYAGDLTRTFPVSGSFTPKQKEVYKIVLAAYEAAVAFMKPGVLFRDVHFEACEQLVKGLQALGLMKGDVKEAVAQGAHALFFQCGLGHMLGMDVHDMENLGEAYVGYTDTLKKSTQFGLKSLRLGRALEPGFVVTVEPGLYFVPELIQAWEAEGKHTSFINYAKAKDYFDFGGIRIEDDYLVTSAGSRLLGEGLIRKPGF